MKRNLRIISGGQTGVDRGALDFALESGISAGGYCPKGRLAEDGPIPLKYPLKEMKSPRYEERTEFNVRKSDGTLIVVRGKLRGGTAYTLRMAKKWQKPVFIFDLDSPLGPEKFSQWLSQEKIEILNIAGPRESQCPGICRETIKMLNNLLSA